MNSALHSSTDKAVAILRKGGIVAFPTDTVYGIGVDPFQPEAVKKLYKIKGRPKDKPIPILVGTGNDVETISQHLPPVFNQLVNQFWPGALTLIVEARNLSPEITAGGKTVGVRMPNHPLALELLRCFGGPIATTSANKSGEAPAISSQEVRDRLGNLVQLVLEQTETFTKVSSTVIDVAVSPPQVRRQGDITEDTLMQFLKK